MPQLRRAANTPSYQSFPNHHHENRAHSQCCQLCHQPHYSETQVIFFLLPASRLPQGGNKQGTLGEGGREAGARFDLRLIWSKMLSVIKLHRYSRGIDWKRVVQRLIIPGFCCHLKRRHGENCKRRTHPGIGRGKNGKWGPVLFFLG